jgi:hypothetical protein
MHAVFKMTALTAALGLTVACAPGDPYARTKTGAGIGAVTGGILGHQIERGEGTAIGAVVGALAGGAVGNYMDRQQQAFEQALAEERRTHNLEIQRLEDDRLKLNIPSEVSFDFDSAAIKPAFRPTPRSWPTQSQPGGAASSASPTTSPTAQPACWTDP